MVELGKKELRGVNYHLLKQVASVLLPSVPFRVTDPEPKAHAYNNIKMQKLWIGDKNQLTME